MDRRQGGQAVVSDVGRFCHLPAFNSLATEVYHVNERIITGD